MKLRSSFLSLLLITSVFLWAAAPTAYYNSANGKNTAALRSALQTIITNGHSVSSYSGLWTAYATTDINPANGKIWDTYSNCGYTLSSGQCGNYSAECDCYNREHTTPQSWFGQASPMVSDLYNVYPTDGKVNGMRSNYPYGEVSNPTYTSGNGCKLGACSFAGYSGTVFEPIDEYKGDFARTYLYMATRYAGQCESWGNSVYSSTNLGLSTFATNLFLKWSRQDPVSAKEINRNNAVYDIQNNRNPFIDYPGLEEYIWGNNTSATFSTSGATVTAPVVSTPTSAGILSTSAVLGGNIISNGNGTITERGVFYSTTSGFADGSGTKVVATGTGSGEFTTSVSGLTASTSYYFKAFVTNSVGTAYSSQASFVTAIPVVILVPGISSPSAQSVSATNAIVSATISSNGGEQLAERGFYWSTTDGFVNGAGTKVLATGTSTGAYNTSIGGLMPATAYYFKGFASNSAGTTYTSQAGFTTGMLNGPTIILDNKINSGSTLAFGKVSGTAIKSLMIKTTNLTANLTVSVSGTMFSASAVSILKTDAEAGYNLLITYAPTVTGTHTGTVAVSGGGLPGNFVVSLTGTR